MSDDWQPVLPAYAAESVIAIERIFAGFREDIRSNQPMAAVDWLDAASQILMLQGAADDVLAQMEADMFTEEAALLAQGNTAAKARVLKRLKIDARTYFWLINLKGRTEEFVRLAKKRADLMRNV